jgi:hypothetical protein
MNVFATREGKSRQHYIVPIETQLNIQAHDLAPFQEKFIHVTNLVANALRTIKSSVKHVWLYRWITLVCLARGHLLA